MHILDPRDVTLEGEPLLNVTALTLDQKAEDLITQWDLLGPHLVFADVPRQRWTLKLTQRLGGDSTAGDNPAALTWAPGSFLRFTFRARHARSDRAREFSGQGVLTSVQHELLSVPRAGPALHRTFALVLVSFTGDAPPITITELP